MKFRPQSSRAFTLIELLASMVILVLMVAMLFTAFNQASKAWLQGENRVETFQQARAALDFMGKELVQAMVTTNVPFVANTDSLAFVAPINETSNTAGLAEISYRLDYSVQYSPRPLTRRVTYYPNANWDFYTFVANPNWPETRNAANDAVLAENIVLLKFEFVDIAGSCLGSKCKFDYWNSTGLNNQWGAELGTGVGACNVPNQPPCTYMTNRAPAGVFITLGVLDSRAANRITSIINGLGLAGTNSAAYASITNQATQYFTTYVAIPNRTP